MHDPISVQHFRNSHWDSDSICGTNMVGARTPQDMDRSTTTCIACKAVHENRPLFGITAIDEDGYIDSQVFNTVPEQLAGIEEAFDAGALNVTMRIIPVGDIKNGEW